jgi:S-adenosylhomocysteine hydrolase
MGVLLMQLILCILHTAYCRTVLLMLCTHTSHSAHIHDAHLAHFQGVVDATAAGAHKLLQLAADSALLVPAMNVSDAVTHSRFATSQSDRVKASLVQGLHTLCGVNVAGKVTRPAKHIHIIFTQPAAVLMLYNYCAAAHVA